LGYPETKDKLNDLLRELKEEGIKEGIDLLSNHWEACASEPTNESIQVLHRYNLMFSIILGFAALLLRC
jgi:hypothetical protein